MMIKKIFSWMIPFYIYSLIVFCFMIICVFTPNSTDIKWLLGWGFYIPYIFIGIHITSFVLGRFIQKRSNTSKGSIRFMLTIISFVITLLNLLIPAYDSIKVYGFQRNFIYTFLPTIGSSILFWIGQAIELHKQQQKNKERFK